MSVSVIEEALPPEQSVVPPKRRSLWRNWQTWPFLLANLLPLLVFVTGVTARAVVLCVVLYAVRMFAITAGYHRYFAHRTFKTSRFVQFLFAFAASTSAQKGPLWWAATHRAHHRYADTDRDPHSPKKGFWWAHMGWILDDTKDEIPLEESVPDLARYPELRFFQRHEWFGPWVLGVACFLIAGWSGLVVGFFLSTVLVWHATFAINSVAHVWGRRRYDTPDTSRNSATLALITFGEGWHNNHHHYPRSARQGFRWWQLDITYEILLLMQAVGLVWDLQRPTAAALAGRPAGRRRRKSTTPGEAAESRQPVSA